MQKLPGIAQQQGRALRYDALRDGSPAERTLEPPAEGRHWSWRDTVGFVWFLGLCVLYAVCLAIARGFNDE
jgi:hypothetical protein